MAEIKADKIAEMEKSYRIALINSLLGYKSLNLLGTANGDGITNLCIISSAFHLGASPPLIGLVMRPQRPHNDTLSNIRLTGQYTLNNVLPAWYKQAHQTSASYPSGESEFRNCGFRPQYISGFRAPFVAESNIKIALELRELIDVEINGTTIVVGEIVQLLIADGLIADDGRINHIKAETMTVSGLDAYFLAQPVGRLSYAKPGTEPLELNC